MPGLGIEAARLRTSTARYSKDVKIASFTVRSRGTEMLINLLNSPHSQLKLINEIHVALCPMSAKTPPERKIVASCGLKVVSTGVGGIPEVPPGHMMSWSSPA